MLTHEPPRLPYCGLTIIVDNPSRFDREAFFSGYAGKLVANGLQPIVRQQCDIRVANLPKPLLPNTKCILLCGVKALRSFEIGTSLAEQRGSPFIGPQGIPCVATFFPQDACDVVDYEAKFNPLDASYESGEDDDDGDKGDNEKDSDTGVKGHGKTKRKNYAFWLLRDLAKAARICLDGGVLQKPLYKDKPIVVYPPSNTVIDFLLSLRDKQLCLDIETDSQLQLTCIGIATDDFTTPVYVIPFRRYDYTHAYANLAHILHALALALSRNTIIGHNVSFDLLVLAYKYHVLFGRNIYDTMLAHHRCFPEVEKSLGHCISLWTDLPYHKNDGVYEPHNLSQEEQLWNYNAKDVVATLEVRNGIESYSKNISGLQASIKQANAAIRPYLITSLQGIFYDEEMRLKILNGNDRRITQLLSLLRIGTGLNINPASPKQVAMYLYCEPPVGLGLPKPQKDLTNEKTLRKLLTRHVCPAINIILEIRRLAKESGMLKFEPWSFYAESNDIV